MSNISCIGTLVLEKDQSQFNGAGVIFQHKTLPVFPLYKSVQPMPDAA